MNLCVSIAGWPSRNFIILFNLSLLCRSIVKVDGKAETPPVLFVEKKKKIVRFFKISFFKITFLFGLVLWRLFSIQFNNEVLFVV